MKRLLILTMCVLSVVVFCTVSQAEVALEVVIKPGAPEPVPVNPDSEGHVPVLLLLPEGEELDIESMGPIWMYWRWPNGSWGCYQPRFISSVEYNENTNRVEIMCHFSTHAFRKEAYQDCKISYVMFWAAGEKYKGYTPEWRIVGKNKN